MGANTYLEAVASKGYKTATAATAILHYIDPRDGERIAIRAYGATCGATATSVYFMQTLGESTIATAVASGATTGLALAGEPVAANALASNDYVAIQMDDQSWHWTTVATGSYDDFSIADALDDTLAAGNKVYFLGAPTDSDHVRVLLAVSVQSTKELDGGIFHGTGKGRPMIVYHANDAAAAGSIDYVAVDFINI